VIIDNLDIRRPGVGPDEADTPLIIDPNAVLTGTIVFERLEAILRRALQIVKPSGRIDHIQFARSDACDTLPTRLRTPTLAEKDFSFPVSKAQDHDDMRYVSRII
jgi:hypothetical protein